MVLESTTDVEHEHASQPSSSQNNPTEHQVISYMQELRKAKRQRQSRLMGGRQELQSRESLQEFLAESHHDSFLSADGNTSSHYYNNGGSSSLSLSKKGHVGVVPEAAEGTAPPTPSLHTSESLRLHWKAMQAVGNRRGAVLADSTTWQTFLEDAALLEHSNHPGEEEEDNHHAHSRIPFYAPPVQRQRWGESQILPHVNYGDVFFDLFYVAAAYNLGSLLISSLHKDDWLRGVVYYVGIFGPLYTMWETKAMYEAQYCVVDYMHRLVDTCRFFLVAFAVLHIKSLELLSNPNSIETFFLTLALLVESLIQIALKVEVYLYAQGDVPAIRQQTKRNLMFSYIPLAIFYGAATTVAGIFYFDETFPDDEDPGRRRSLAAGETTKEGYDNSTDDYNNTYSEEDHGWSASDIPFTVCFVAYNLNIFTQIARKCCCLNPKKVDIRDYLIPTNIDYMIHRYNEWLLLMVGESVLSLLIVDTTESLEYYTVACLGIATVIVLQALKFESEPSHADGHPMWRDLKAQLSFSILIQILSMSLIALGVSYKVILSIVKADDPDRRTLAEADASIATDLAVAALFTGSLTIVLIALEFMLNMNQEAQRNYALLLKVWHDPKQSKKANWPLVYLTIFKGVVIFIVATLSLWITNPTTITSIGFVVVVIFGLTRIFGWSIVHRKQEMKQALQQIKPMLKEASKKIGESSRNILTMTELDRTSTNPFVILKAQQQSSGGISSNTAAASDQEHCEESLLIDDLVYGRASLPSVPEATGDGQEHQAVEDDSSSLHV